MHPDGWLRRRSTRFHGIKDSALNPRDCRGCVEGREGQREGDRASARSERGQWSRRRRKGAGRVLGFWVRSAPRSSEEGCSVRRMWNSRSAHSVTPAAAYPSSVHTPWCDTYDPPILPPFSLSFLPSFVSSSLSLSSCYPLPSDRSHCLTLRYYYYRSRGTLCEIGDRFHDF